MTDRPKDIVGPISDPKPYRIPTIAYVRPCTRIAGEAIGSDGIFTSLADRYGALTDPLPLAGREMLTVNAEGEIALIARLRAAAPRM